MAAYFLFLSDKVVLIGSARAAAFATQGRTLSCQFLRGLPWRMRSQERKNLMDGRINADRTLRFMTTRQSVGLNVRNSHPVSQISFAMAISQRVTPADLAFRRLCTRVKRRAPKISLLAHKRG